MDNPSGNKSALGLDANVAAGLAYLPICLVNVVMSIIILATDKTNKFARFAAFQSLILCGVMIAGYIVTMMVGVAGAASNSSMLSMLSLVVWLLLILVPFIASVVCCIMAFMNKEFKLPVIGDLADKWSN